MAIKMRVNTNNESTCNECSCAWKNTAEMYDLMLCSTRYTLCKECIDTLFNKTLKANCLYNGRLKSQEDLRRAERASMRKRRVEE